jgi:FkbM family methyltransferase
MKLRTAVTAALNRGPEPLTRRIVQSTKLRNVLRPVVNMLVPTEYTEVVVRSGRGAGLRLRIDPQVEKYYWTGQHETAVQDALSGWLRPGGVVWDVGAHIGFMSLIAQRAVGSAGTVVAFEPIPENAERLRGHIAANRAAVRVVEAGVAREVGEAVMYKHGGSTLQWSLEPLPGSERLTVPITTLDAALANHPVPDVVKIDAEGAEADILAGATQLLEHGPVIIVEIWDSPDQVRALLPSGWTVEDLDGSNYLLRR